MTAQELTAALPEGVRSLLQEEPSLFVAGGWIRDTWVAVPPKDIDLWSRRELHEAQEPELLHKLEQRFGGWQWSPSAWTFPDAELPVQLVRSRWGSPQKVIGTFDFSICQAALWWEDGSWQFYATDGYLKAIVTKTLTWTGADDGHAGRSVRRMVELAARGYNVPSLTVETVCRALVQQAAAAGPKASQMLAEIHYAKDSE